MSLKDSFISAWESYPISIQSGTSMSDLLNLGGLRLFGLTIPSDWTTADITFQMSPDEGVTWFDVHDASGQPAKVSASADGFFAVDPRCFASIQNLRVRSGTAGAEVQQTGDRSLQLILRKV